MSGNKYQIIDQISQLHSTLSESLTGKHILVRCMANEQIFTIFSRNAQKKVAPASTIKVFLLNILLNQNIDLDEFLEIEEADLSLGSGNNLKVGQHYRVYDLIMNLMTASSNTAAKVLARYVEQSLGQSYVDYANQYHTNLGFKNTHLINPHGLAHRQQYVTLSDFALLLDQKIQDNDFLRMMCSSSYQFQSLEGDNILIQNTYPDLELKECLGVKTGTLVPGVFNIILFFEIKGIRGYIIDFYNENKESRNQDMLKILQTLKNYHEDLV